MAPQRRGSSPSSASCSPTCGGLSYDGLFLAKVRSGHIAQSFSGPLGHQKVREHANYFRVFCREGEYRGLFGGTADPPLEASANPPERGSIRVLLPRWARSSVLVSSSRKSASHGA